MEHITTLLQGGYAYLLIFQIFVVTALFLLLVVMVVRRIKNEAMQSPGLVAGGAVAVSSEEVEKLQARIQELEADNQRLQGSNGDAAQLQEKVTFLESKLLEYEILQEEIGSLSNLKSENEKLKAELSKAGVKIPETPAAVATQAPEAAPAPAPVEAVAPPAPPEPEPQVPSPVPAPEVAVAPPAEVPKPPQSAEAVASQIPSAFPDALLQGVSDVVVPPAAPAEAQVPSPFPEELLSKADVITPAAVSPAPLAVEATPPTVPPPMDAASVPAPVMEVPNLDNLLAEIDALTTQSAPPPK